MCHAINKTTREAKYDFIQQGKNYVASIKLCNTTISLSKNKNAIETRFRSKMLMAPFF